MSSSIQSKSALRKALRKLRRALPKEVRETKSQAMVSRIREQPWYAAALKVAVYYPTSEEVNTLDLAAQAAMDGKTVYWPLVNPRASEKPLRFIPLDPPMAKPEGLPEQWCRNRYSIWEPQADYEAALTPEHLDVVFIPLLGFDDQGNRLGMGGGHYDATLGAVRLEERPLAVGLGFEFQRLAAIPMEPFDVPMDHIVTEDRVITGASRQNSI